MGSVPQAEAFAVALSYAGLVVAIVLLLGAAAAFFLPRDFNVSPQKADCPGRGVLTTNFRSAYSLTATSLMRKWG